MREGEIMLKKAIWIFSSFLVFSLFPLSYGVNYIIPDSVNLIEGHVYDTEYNFPFKLSINESDEGIYVSGQEPQKVETNIEIDLDDEYIKSEMAARVSILGIPIKTVSVNIIPNRKIIPCGNIAGISVKTEGVLVLGTAKVMDKTGVFHSPAQDNLRTGDIILNCNDKIISKKEHLIEEVKTSQGKEISLKIKRGEDIFKVKIVPQTDEKGEHKIGVWVRDSTQGLGTVTYIDEQNMSYGALGHGIYDVDTKKLMSIVDGTLLFSEVTGIKAGTDGTPGEVSGTLKKESVIGTVEKNTEQGIFGQVNASGLKKFRNKPMEIGLAKDIIEGEAIILSDILGGEVVEYKVNIESVNRFSTHDKGMIVKVVDERLLKGTGGIIQGMSGSPIIQNNKIIGAVTHVFVKDSAKGYGIFIENMLASSKN